MALPYDPNNPYGTKDVPNRLMPLASLPDVGVEPELQRVSLDTNQPNWQRDVTESANMAENHESRLPAKLDAPINYSYQPPLSAPGFSVSQSFSVFPSTSRTHEHFECGSESKRLRPTAQRNKIRNPPPRKGVVSNNSKGCISVAGRRLPGRNNASRRKITPQSLQTYACPLYLQNREKHKRCKNCVLTSWGRVLQHLKRTHLAEEDHCPKCCCSFSSATQKDEHIRRSDCQSADIAQSGVLLEEDYDSLKYIRHNSDEGKWTEAWGRLFPGLPAPSPFCESDAEMITRTGRPACIKALQKAKQGYGNLSALADELLDELTHALVPATRGCGINTPAAEASQGVDSEHNRSACSPGRLLGQAKQVTRSTVQFRDLPEASPLMVPPQVPPDTPLPSQEQIFAQSQQMPPGLSGVEQFSPETLQGWLPIKHSHSMTSQLPQYMLNDISLSQPSFATPTNLHSNVYNDVTSFLSDEVMISGEWAFGRDEAEAN